MFDNDQNFNNNPRPLFENEFNNINKNYQNDINNFQSTQLNPIENPFFANNINESNSMLSQDMPPELGEIKNLNEAEKVDAPTMDVLSPMNVMPESPLATNDPISLYESGNIDLGFKSNLNESSAFQQAQTSFQNQNPFQFNNNIESEKDLLQGQMGIQNTNPFLNNNDFLSNINYNAPTDYAVKQEPFSTDYGVSENNVQTDDLFSTKLGTDTQENNSEEYSIIQDKELKEPEEYSIVQDSIVEDPMDELKEAKSTQEDSLDIMDFEEDVEEDIKDESIIDEQNEKPNLTESEDEEKPLLKEQVRKIEMLVNEMKASGIDIKLEQYDFEHMYQLIVKINK